MTLIELPVRLQVTGKTTENSCLALKNQMKNNDKTKTKEKSRNAKLIATFACILPFPGPHYLVT